MKVLLVNDETIAAEKTLLNSGEVILFSRASLSTPLNGSGPVGRSSTYSPI